jgi:hypothetical protein
MRKTSEFWFDAPKRLGATLTVMTVLRAVLFSGRSTTVLCDMNTCRTRLRARYGGTKTK